jgi:hypothetical protein
MMPETYIRIGQELVLGNDAAQWILYRPKRADYGMDWIPSPAKLRPIGFCRTRAEGLILTLAGRNLPRWAAKRP